MKLTKPTSAIGILAVCLLLCLLFIWHTMPGNSGGPSLAEKQPSRAETPQPSIPNNRTGGEDITKASVKMSPWEFDHLQVHLPDPVNAAWKGPLYDSRSCFDPDKKLAAVHALPIWIRKAILAGDTDLAARYLWTFLKFTDDTNKEVETDAVMSLYQMGDFKGTAISKMKEWLEKGVDYTALDTTFGATTIQDTRQQVLQEMGYYKDTRLLGTIYDIWSKSKDNEGEDLASVDYAYYLEKQGMTLPAEYWLNRLKTPYAFDHALEVLENTKPEGLTGALEPLFEQLESKPISSIDAGRAAEVAEALFKLTGSSGYRDYLVGQAQTQLASGSVTSSLPQTLSALAATNDDLALGVLSTAMQSRNPVIRETAIDALGNSRNPKAAAMLSESAAQDAKTRFPNRQLHALLEQNNPASDSKYEQLQQALLSGQLGWHATSSDFAALEAVRQYGR